MISSRTTTVTAVVCLQLASLMSVAVCDYQIEVNLISYNNSARRLDNGQGQCCDVKTNNTMQPAASCLGQDTCDVQFKFSAENFTTRMKFSGQSVVIGPYQDSDVITFDRCCTLMDSSRNPLVFLVPSTDWRNGEIVRILAEIVDVDENSMSSSEETIMSERPILLLQQPLPPSLRQNYVQGSFFGSIFLNLTFQYRVICSAGTCGSDCSQTTNCQPFPSCVPVTCADLPCLNGGTCSNVRGCSFLCTCRGGFTGATCGIVLPSSSSESMKDPGFSTTTTMMTTSLSQDEKVQNCPITTAVVSSVIVFIFTSLLFLTIGMIIGYFIHKRKFTANLKNSIISTPPDKPATTTAHTSDVTRPPRAPHDQPTFPPPEYAPIHASVEQHVQGFGMKKCEAYAPSSQSTAIAGASPGGCGGQSTGGGRPEEHGYSPVQISTSNNYVSFNM